MYSNYSYIYEKRLNVQLDSRTEHRNGSQPYRCD